MKSDKYGPTHRAPLDPLIHSLRWNQERIIRRARDSLWEWQATHYGDRPAALHLHPYLLMDLLSAVESITSGAVTLPYPGVVPGVFKLFGIPIVVDRSARGFDWRMRELTSGPS
jgi:hypothetical protein